MAGTNLGTAYVAIMPTSKGIGGSLSNAIGGEASSAGTKAGNLFTTAMKGILTGAAVAAVGKFFKDAIDQGAQLQQSFGGLDTIYGDASESMKQMAYEASQAGISANDYAEQAVSFGASLKQAFGGDTQKAAEAANTAIMDMADNAAKMGTPIESIQQAYQGFARGQYQLLDNLKLGYGGTKEEMERLLSDAQELTGVEYDINNLGDVYDAIHVIQGELGLTGVAAEEGATTFSGSMAAMKASASNLLANLALGEDISGPLTDLISNVGNFLTNNLFPMIGNILSQLPGLIGQGLQWAFENIPNIIDTVIGFINNLATSISEGSGEFKEKMVEMGHQALEMFKSIDWKGLGLAIVQLLWEGIKALAPVIWELLKWIGTTAWDWFKNVDWAGLGMTILRLILQGLQALGSLIWQGLKSIAQTAWDNFKNTDWLGLGTTVLKLIAEGLWSLNTFLWGKVKELAQNAWDSFTGFDWWGLGTDIINGIVNGIISLGSTIADTLLGFASDAWNSVMNFFGIGSPSKLMRDTVGKWLPLGIAEGIDDEASAVTDAMNRVAEDAVTGFDIDANVSGVGAAAAGMADNSSTTINVYASPGMDINELADEIQQRLALIQRQKQAAWGTA